MQGIGYRHFVAVLLGELTAAEATRLMQRDTLRYAKRQWTWFAREPDVQWLDVALGGGPDGVAALIAERLAERGLIGGRTAGATAWRSRARGRSARGFPRPHSPPPAHGRARRRWTRRADWPPRPGVPPS